MLITNQDLVHNKFMDLLKKLTQIISEVLNINRLYMLVIIEKTTIGNREAGDTPSVMKQLGGVTKCV